MKPFRDRLHQLIDHLSEEELAEIWTILINRYSDLYMLRAIQASKQLLRPGDTFTREEALRFLGHS
jgi:hypothetical protein